MKKRVAALILGLFFILNALPCAALDINPATDRDFDVPCQAAILIDEDSGTVLYEKNNYNGQTKSNCRKQAYVRQLLLFMI